MRMHAGRVRIMGWCESASLLGGVWSIAGVCGRQAGVSLPWLVHHRGCIVFASSLGGGSGISSPWLLHRQGCIPFTVWL
jgi:hypothetical protein